MPQTIETINPLNYSGWDELVLGSKNYSFFHSSNWARVLHMAYGYSPVYWAAMNRGKVAALIPCMEVNSILTGKRGVSLPFTDYCETMVFEPEPSAESISSLIAGLIEYGREESWSSIELRCGASPYREPIPHSYACYGHVLELSKNNDALFASFRDTTKRNIRKAMKLGVEVKISKSMAALREFYRLNCLTRREHGLPPQPLRFFEKVYDHVLSEGRGIVVLAHYDGTCIAGAVYFHMGERAVYKYGASDSRYLPVRSNNLVMWEAIRWYARNGFKTLCFGRTEGENEGLRQFKRGWNTKERTIHYYKYDLKKDTFVDEVSMGLHGAMKVFRNMPIPILRMTGSVLYKHIG